MVFPFGKSRNRDEPLRTPYGPRSRNASQSKGTQKACCPGLIGPEAAVRQRTFGGYYESSFPVVIRAHGAHSYRAQSEGGLG
jgi:hypothetical protein